MRIRSINDDCFLGKRMAEYKAYLIVRGYNVYLVNSIFAKYARLTKGECLRRYNPNFKHKIMHQNKSIEEHEMDRSTAINGPLAFYSNIIKHNQRMMINKHLNDTTINTHIKSHLIKNQIVNHSNINDNDIKLQDESIHKIYLVRTYHQNSADFYSILADEYERFIATNTKLKLLFPIDLFKISWKRNKNLAEMISGHNFNFPKRIDEELHYPHNLIKYSTIDRSDPNIIHLGKESFNITHIKQWKGFMCTRYRS
eukprot:48720_1